MFCAWIHRKYNLYQWSLKTLHTLNVRPLAILCLIKMHPKATVHNNYLPWKPNNRSGSLWEEFIECGFEHLYFLTSFSSLVETDRWVREVFVGGGSVPDAISVPGRCHLLTGVRQPTAVTALPDIYINQSLSFNLFYITYFKGPL